MLAAPGPFVINHIIEKLPYDPMKDFELITPDYESCAWFGLAAPKGTPKAVIERLNRETVAIIRDPAIQKRLIEIGFEPWATSADEFRDFIAGETQKWTKIIARAGIKAN